jgi:hypothetical protein
LDGLPYLKARRRHHGSRHDTPADLDQAQYRYRFFKNDNSADFPSQPIHFLEPVVMSCAVAA